MSLNRRLPSLAITTGLALALTLCASLAPAASADYYLKIDTIEGESTAMPVETFELRAIGEGPVATLLLPAVQKVREAAARPDLAQLACDGTVIRRLVVDVRQGGKQEPYLTYELTNVLISSYSIQGNSSTGLPMEQLSLNYERATWTHLESGETRSFECTSGRCVCAP